MFKKLKDKLAEEVKSSPQRIQQFAQAAQAAVTSASSSITDITNNDLFTIGDNESNQQSKKATGTLTPSSNAFQDVSLHSSTQSDHVDFHPSNFPPEHSRQRKLSNSSFASDVSFKLPSYESTSMYHLQSDMDVSASEAEERGLASPGVTLERVTKEQLYAAYRRTQERYSKYRTQYADLARHYKLLERDNAKARSVLVETQDKALRRISELREQCSLEQSAKAHLERALRVEIEEKNMKIDTLNTQIKCLQDNSGTGATDTSPNESQGTATEEKVEQLIDISSDTKTAPETNTEIINLNSKIEKLEQLMNKYKESHKLMKEKNSQLTTELQVLHKETDKIKEENNEYQKNKKDLEVAFEQIKNENEDLQNKLNQYDFSKTKEMSSLELDLEKAKEEITQLQSKVDIFAKREEENAISLAENKLSIHKELESKESEIRSLKSSLENQEKNVQKLTKLSNDYKAKISNLEQEILQHTSSISELQLSKHETSDKEAQLQDLKSKCQVLEQLKSKAEEECRCLQLQNKQEIAEKLAMIDRNSYLEERNKQLTEENARKVTQLSSLEKDLEKMDKSDNWKDKYLSLEAEMHEERVELAKLQTEIEKLLKNDELVQNENSELHKKILELQSTKEVLQNKMKNIYNNVNIKIKDIKTSYDAIVKEMRKTESNNKLFFSNMDDEIKCLLSSLHHESEFEVVKTTLKELETSKSILETLYNELKEKNELLLVENDNLKTNIRELTSKYENSDTDKCAALNAELLEIKTQYKNKLKEMSLLQDENSKIRAQIVGTEGKDKKMEKDFSELTGKHEELQSEYNNIKIELDNNIENNKKLKLTNDKVQNNLDLLKREYESSLNQLKSLREDNVSLKDSLQIAEQQCEDLKSKCNILTTDNKELKVQFETIVSDVGTLENELTDIRKSHEDIEKEKDHLNSIIEQLEQNRESKQYQDAESQYTDDLEKNLKEKIESLSEENNVLKAKCEQTKQEKENLYEKLIVIENKCTEHEQNLIEQSRLVTENDQLTQELLEKTNELSKMNNDVQMLNSTISDLKLKTEKFETVSSTSNEIAEKYEVLKQEYDILKEDNRRLLSDIEGLQTYLTKISKENSVLNDKLRESIASSETNVDRSSGDITEELEVLKSELLIEKSRVEDLLRQNNMLAEENFELKDQIQSHSYVKPLEINKENAHNAEKTTIQNKYDAIVKKNTELDRKINDLEILNQSNNVNVEQLQESNKKLRLSNEKLERRLDEALVSLRHLHSLQENTELEYLRNILYEYLTGPGTHSLTLAKVLSAVVKFDDKQTNFILQKEKERQGLLRQLGLT